MQTICGISIEDDKAFLSFANIKKKTLMPLAGKEIALTLEQDFIKKLKNNIETIERTIVEVEQKYSTSVIKIFIELPPNLAQELEINETIVFSKKKKIKTAVINYVKKYIENKFLEWDHHCIHNIILNCQTEGIRAKTVPLGILTNKIRVNALLIYVKDAFYKEISDIFYNIERNLAGFVAHKISILSEGAGSFQNKQIVISVNNFKSYVVIQDGKGKIVEKTFDFSIKEIIKELSDKYSISPVLSFQILARYGSFKTIPYFKEITIKKEDSYLNLSIKVLGNFLKEIFSKNIKSIIDNSFENIKTEEQSDFVFTFIGPLTTKDGFYNYIRQLLPYDIEVPVDRHESSSFGCAYYGYRKPLERNHKEERSFLAKIKKVYHEYF